VSTATGSERKLVSVLFADLSGFTAVAETMDPEDVHAFLQPTMTQLAEIVDSYGGTIAKWMGDGFMAVFGVPTSHQDDAERAVRAALACRDAVRRRKQEVPTWPGPSELHAGIQTGEVLVIPTPKDLDVIGDTVNTAARLLSVAPGGCVLVGERTRNLTDHAATYLEWAPIRLKGKARPIRAYQALDVAEDAGGRPVSAAPTPFVGRTLELGRLQARLERAEADRRSEVVLVVGVAGVGKSRLLSRFTELSSQAVSLVGRCAPYGERAPWHALAGLIREHAGLRATETAEEAHSRLAGAVEAVLTDATEEARAVVVEGLAALTGLEPAAGFPGAGELNLDIAAAVRRFLTGMARRRPVVVVLEDLQWADPQLLAFATWVVEEPWPAPVVFACAAWPEILGSEGLKLDPHDVVSLESLEDEDAVAMIERLLEGEVPEPLARQLLERSGGNPLFLEETIHLLREREDLRREDGRWTLPAAALGAVPETVHLVVAARLDALEEAERRLIRDASIAGQTFWRELLGALGWGRDLEPALDGLIDRGLVSDEPSSTLPGASELRFKHAVIRDVAYGGMPRAERAERHLAVAAWLRSTAPTADEEPVDLLAFHYAQAVALRGPGTGSVARRATEYLKRAGDRASGQFAHREAATLYEQALGLTEAVAADPGAAPVLAEARLGLAESLTYLFRFGEAGAAATAVRELAESNGRRDWEARALVVLGMIESDLSDVAAARRTLERAAAIFEELGDARGRARVLYESHLTWRLDDLDRQSRTLEEAARAFGELGDFWRELRCYQDLAWTASPRGGPEFDRWYARLDELTARAGDPRSIGALRRAWGYFRAYAGDLETAREALSEAARLGQDVGDPDLEVESRFPLAQIALASGDLDAAEDQGRRLREAGRRRSLKRLESQGTIVEARVAARRGAADEAVERLERAEVLLSEIGAVRELSEILLARAELAVETGRFVQALSFAERFAESCRLFGDSLWVPYATLLGGLARLGMGARDGAAEAFRRAREEAEAVGNVLVPARAAWLLAEIRALSASPPETTPAGSLPTPFERAIAAETRALSGDEPEESWAAALEAWEALGITAWQARALALRARWLEAGGRSAEAAAARGRADEILEGLGSPSRWGDLVPG
jgi:class 3 adenylate cyclase/tetratricopeptide (TPR) repeat protein